MTQRVFETSAELDAEVSIDVLHVDSGGQLLESTESTVLWEGEATNSLESFLTFKHWLQVRFAPKVFKSSRAGTGLG